MRPSAESPRLAIVLTSSSFNSSLSLGTSLRMEPGPQHPGRTDDPRSPVQMSSPLFSSSVACCCVSHIQKRSLAYQPATPHPHVVGRTHRSCRLNARLPRDTLTLTGRHLHCVAMDHPRRRHRSDWRQVGLHRLMCEQFPPYESRHLAACGAA